MAVPEIAPLYDPNHPEGLTLAQEALAEMLITSQVNAPITRRLGEPGNFRFVTTVCSVNPVDFALQEGEFAFKLHEEHADAPLSPIRLSLRELPSRLEQSIAQAMAEIPDRHSPEACVGIPNAGTPLAREYARIMGIPALVSLRKVYGNNRRRIMGIQVPQGVHEVRVVDDLITQGHTKVEALTELRHMGVYVTDLTVLVDYGLGAREQLALQGIELRSVFTVKQLLDYYLRAAHVNRQQYDAVIEWMDQMQLSA